jgi:hypothetical protein
MLLERLKLVLWELYLSQIHYLGEPFQVGVNCRSQNVGERRKWVGVVEEVKSAGGEVLIFSSIHESGKQLDQLTGVAAILNFPLPEIESDEEDAPAENNHK